MSRKQKKMLVRIIVAAVIFAGGLFVPQAEQFTLLWFVRLGVFLAAYFTAGWDILWIASIGAMIIGEYSDGVAVIIFYQVGELLQSVAVGKSRKSISDMMDINPEYATVERNGEEIEVEPDEVAVGETVVIKPGERIPLDGEVIFGSSGLNTAALTGESAPRDVTVGDEVISGCFEHGRFAENPCSKAVFRLYRGENFGACGKFFRKQSENRGLYNTFCESIYADCRCRGGNACGYSVNHHGRLGRLGLQSADFSCCKLSVCACHIRSAVVFRRYRRSVAARNCVDRRGLS